MAQPLVSVSWQIRGTAERLEEANLHATVWEGYLCVRLYLATVWDSSEVGEI